MVFERKLKFLIMKKILFAVLALTLILSIDQASAINLDKLAGVVEGATQKNSQKKIRFFGARRIAWQY